MTASDREAALAWSATHVVELRSYHQPCGWSCAYRTKGEECPVARWLATLDAALAAHSTQPPPLDPEQLRLALSLPIVRRYVQAQAFGHAAIVVLAYLGEKP